MPDSMGLELLVVLDTVVVGFAVVLVAVGNVEVEVVRVAVVVIEA